MTRGRPGVMGRPLPLPLSIARPLLLGLPTPVPCPVPLPGHDGRGPTRQGQWWRHPRAPGGLAGCGAGSCVCASVVRWRRAELWRRACHRKGPRARAPPSHVGLRERAPGALGLLPTLASGGPPSSSAPGGASSGGRGPEALSRPKAKTLSTAPVALGRRQRPAGPGTLAVRDASSPEGAT